MRFPHIHIRSVVIVSVVLLTLTLTGIIVLNWCGKAPCSGRQCVFTVERGWGARKISQALTDSSLVRCRLFLLWKYSRMEGTPPLQAGTYLLDDSMPPDSILGILASGDVIPIATNWITLTPGMTLCQSLDVLSCSTDLQRSVLDSIASDSSFLSLSGIPCLEGYLFPESYELADTLEAAEIIDRIIGTGLARWPDDTNESLLNTGLTLHETIILASIVEREAKVDSERAVIAGVFLSRLRTGMRLESCATVQYALGEVKEVLLYRDLEIDDPYNTYVYSGLPPGPICSPGLPSIEAAFHPDTLDGYLYFVSRDDGTGRHLFARSHSGHLANIRSLPSR